MLPGHEVFFSAPVRRRHAAAAFSRLLAESPVVIHTIGFCIGEKHSLNQPGRIDYRAADDPVALARGLSAVLAESPDFTVTDF